MGIFTGEPLCRDCKLQKKTAEHLIFECRDWERTETLGSLDKLTDIPQDKLVTKMLKFMELKDLFGDV